MRIYTDDDTRERFEIDRTRLQRWMLSEGFTPIDIEYLDIYLRKHPRGQYRDCTDATGIFRLGNCISGRNSIHIWTYDRTVRDINETLLHEIRHYWQHATNAYTLPQWQHFQTLPYTKQPHEIDAAVFAYLNLPRHRFIRDCQQVPMFSSPMKPVLTGPMKWVAIGLGAVASLVS